MPATVSMGDREQRKEEERKYRLTMDGLRVQLRILASAGLRFLVVQ